MTDRRKQLTSEEIRRNELVEERRGMVVISGGLDKMTPWQFDRVAEIDEELKKLSVLLPPKRKQVQLSKSAMKRLLKPYKPDLSDLEDPA